MKKYHNSPRLPLVFGIPNKNEDACYYIVAILDNTSKVVVRYTYDSWGNHDITVLDSSCEQLANLNPFRYRGYYYDTETDLYFLKTRYYDPKIGRFISIDGISYLNPNAINGLNLYAYCNNNPVMAIDPNGNAWWNPLSWNWEAIGTAVTGAALAVVGATVAIGSAIIGGNVPGSGVITQAGVSMAAYGGIMVASAFDSTIKANMDDIGWNPFNGNEDLVLRSQKVSFYKGVPIFRHSIPFATSLSFGFILLNRDDVDADTIKHEWGHNVQLSFLGLRKYVLGILLPSVSANLLSRNVSNPIGLFLHDNYYSLPWERTAELFGSANNDEYLPYSKEASLVYLFILMGL